jgi:WD40 repeat protein
LTEELSGRKTTDEAEGGAFLPGAIHMRRFDRVLIDPRLDELGTALRSAVESANDRRRQRLVAWPLEGWDRLLTDLHQPAGYRQWNGGAGPARSGEGRSAVALAWWTDRAGRKHHRIVGRYGTFSRPMLDNLLCPFGEVRPPLWFVYPHYVFLKRQGQERLAQAICACGAHGEPDELGWMGSSCDACYDRGVEGQLTTPAWLDPAQSTFHGEEGKLLFLAFSPDGQTLAGGTRRDMVTLWDTRTGLERGHLSARHSEWIVCVGWIDGGQRIVTGDVTGKLRYYSDRTGLPTGESLSAGTSECFAVSPDGRLICRGDRSHVTLLNAHDVQPAGQFAGQLPQAGCLAFSPDGKCLAAGSRRGILAVWEVGTGQEKWRLERPGSMIAALAFSPHGQTLAVALLPASGSTAPDAGRVLLCDAASGQVKTTLPGHNGGSRCVAFAPDGRVLASGGDDGVVRLWEVHSGQERIALEWHLDSVCSVAFAPDGLTLASGSFDGTIKLWPREVLRPSQPKRDRGAVAP